MTSDVLIHLEQQHALLDEWVEARRQVAMWEAKAADALARRTELMDVDVAEAPHHRDAISRSMVAEFSSAGRIAKGSAEQAFADARLLRDTFPALRKSFAHGDVSVAHVREILRAARPVIEGVNKGTVSPRALDIFEAAALEFAENEAPARTRAHVRELAAALAPQTVVERHKRARADQYVGMRPSDDETSFLIALLPTYKVEAILDRLSAMAREMQAHPENRTPTLPPLEPDLFPDGSTDSTVIRGTADTYAIDPFLPGEPVVYGSWVPEADPLDDPDASAAYDAAIARIIAAGPVAIQIPGDDRSLDQIKAELLTDLLLGGSPSDAFGDGLENITARVQITVAATTLAGLDDNPAQVDGQGTLDPDIARALAGAATCWTRLFLGPTGLVTRTDTYLPTAGMRRHLRARDQHCRFPGCRMPVHRCELDHTLDWAKGGSTSLDNLAHLCKAHHALKHPDVPAAHRWTARQLPDWSIEWTSPAGRTLQDAPPRRVMFVPSGPPEPPPPPRPSTDIDWTASDLVAAPF